MSARQKAFYKVEKGSYMHCIIYSGLKSDWAKIRLKSIFFSAKLKFESPNYFVSPDTEFPVVGPQHTTNRYCRL